MQQQDPKVYVQKILEVHKKYNALVLVSFKNDSGFVAALDKACGKFINTNAVTTTSKNTSKSPELLAKYCDILLKKSSKNPEEAELEDTLNQVMVVFKYIEDKDVFQKFYSKMLAKRLVNHTSASDDAEASMISKLKQACGYEYTIKLQRMFQVCVSLIFVFLFCFINPKASNIIIIIISVEINLLFDRILVFQKI